VLLIHAIGKAGAALVEDDQARELRQPLEKVGERGLGPELVDVDTQPMTNTRSIGPSPITW